MATTVSRVIGCCILLTFVIEALADAPDCGSCVGPPRCRKVCKLVCDTKKLTAIGYANDCKTICLAPPSRCGCKWCACQCGECKNDPCSCCQATAPKFEFCWRDWFACGCARPKTIKVLTKYQCEKKIRWYHWEVVDISCCDCVSKDFEDWAQDDQGIAESPVSHDVFKAAPETADVGDVFELNEAEWAKISALPPADLQDPAE